MEAARREVTVKKTIVLSVIIDDDDDDDGDDAKSVIYHILNLDKCLQKNVEKIPHSNHPVHLCVQARSTRDQTGEQNFDRYFDIFFII